MQLFVPPLYLALRQNTQYRACCNAAKKVIPAQILIWIAANWHDACILQRTTLMPCIAAEILLQCRYDRETTEV
jgi:hypothetical protein